MAKKKQDDFMKDLIKENITGNTGDIVDVITFVEASWGMKLKLYPAQRFILKSLYNVPLNKFDKSVIVPNQTNEKNLYKFTETEFLQFLYDEGRCNTNKVEGKNFIELILAIGRRGGKCRYVNDYIATTKGTMTFDDLLRRKEHEDIGILTYDSKTLKKSITKDFKIWNNGYRECYEVVTETGKREISSGNHPYLVLYEDEMKFTELKRLKVGDNIAISKETLFGSEQEDEAYDLGFDYNNENERVMSKTVAEGGKYFIAQFLKGLYDSCGHEALINSNITITYSFDNREKAFFANHSLLKFGIETHFRTEGNKSLLIINDKRSIYLFNKEIKETEYQEYIEEIDYDEDDVFIDKIISINSVGELETVDLEVSDTHIIGGDIVSHNSTLASCISCYELYKLIRRSDPADYYGLPPGNPICITSVAPTDDQAGQVFEYIQGGILNCPYMSDRVLNKTQTYFNIQTDYDIALQHSRRSASLTVLTGGCSSNSLRGKNNIAIILDELAFFIDNGGRFSGSEVYKALKPSIARFKKPNSTESDGKIISISSPYAKYGLFYDRYNDSINEQDTTLMFQMYSAMLNPEIAPSLLISEKKRDKLAFATEFAAEFADNVKAWIDEEEKFWDCVNKDKPKPTRGCVGEEYYLGMDFGVKNDGTAIAIVHKNKEKNKIIVDYVDAWYSGSSDIWDLDENIYQCYNKYKNKEMLQVNDIVSEVKELSKWFPIRKGMLDQFNGYTLMQTFHEEGMKQIDMESCTDKLNSQMYKLLESLYLNDKIEFCNDEVMISEMLMLEMELRNKRTIKVEAPRKKGAHDDISDAVARAVWLIYNSDEASSKKMAVSAGNISAGKQSMSSFAMKQRKAHGMNARNIPQQRRKFK